MFSSLIFSNPTSESERNKESNDSYKSHPQQRLKIGLWAQNSAHIKWNGYVGCGLCHKTDPTSFSKIHFKFHGILGNIFIL